MVKRYLALDHPAPIPVGHRVQVQVFLDDLIQPHVLLRDLTTGILYASDKMLVEGAPPDGPLDGEKSAFRAQRLVPEWRKVAAQFRGRVVECTLVRATGPDRVLTSLAVDEEIASDAPYR